MLKGHVKIELTDVNTGEKQVIEGDNMMTGVPNLLKRLYLRNCYKVESHDAYNTKSIGETLLGGIMLFDDTLNTTGEHINEFPTEAHFVASGTHSVNTTSSLCGSFNSLESGYGTGATSYTQVWDFNTSQANGTIKSLALTSNHLNDDNSAYASKLFDPYYLSGDDWIMNGQTANEGVYVYDDTLLVFQYWNDYFTALKNNLNTLGVTIHDYAQGLYTVGNVYRPTGFTVYNFVRYGYYNPFDGYYYMAAVTATNKFQIYKVSLHTANDTVGPTSYTATDCTFWWSSGYTYDRTVVTNRYIYVIKSTQTSVYRINLTNLSDITEISMPSGVTLKYGNNCISDKLAVFATSTERVVVIYEDGTVVYDPYSEYMPMTGNYPNTYAGDIYSRCQYSSACLNIIGNYCGTRYNLPSPIVKTAAQSMKISYTISDVLTMSISSQPARQDVTLGNTATFSVTVINDSHTVSNPTQYQWQYYTPSLNEWADITGATSSTYTFTPVASDTGKSFRCKITDNTGLTRKSIPANLTVA